MVLGPDDVEVLERFDGLERELGLAMPRGGVQNLDTASFVGDYLQVADDLAPCTERAF